MQQRPESWNAGRQLASIAGDSFDNRFPTPQFKDRFPAADESFRQRQQSEAPSQQVAKPEKPLPYEVASLPPNLPYQAPARGDQTTLVGLNSSAFPYLGNTPDSDEPFLNISKGDRRGHRSHSGRVYWQDQT